jgi:Ca2+:H+ antiporter
MAHAPRNSRSRTREKQPALSNSPVLGHLPPPVNAPPSGNGPVKIKPAGESGRRGFHPLHFFRIVLRSASWISAAVNILWPVVPVALAVRYSRPDEHLAIFVLAYLAMVPCANLVGFAGQELARKFNHVFGVLTEVTLGSVVEIIMFHVLLRHDQFIVIKAAILGSILATMLLCLGLVFFVGGVRRDNQTFNEAISETGNGLLLVAGFALAIPTVFDHSVTSFTAEVLANRVTDISRITAILLMISYLVYAFFQARSHHGIYDAIFEADEHVDRDGHRDRAKPKLTLTECIIALAIAITLVTFMAIILVEEIPFIVEERGVSDPFMGLILVPLVEKAAEHLTAIDEAWDDQMNFAMSHVLGATIQTAMFNGPLVVISGWGLNKAMDLSFETFEIVSLILAIITVGNFLRDQKSNYLEGFLCVIIYVLIAIAAAYYPNPAEHGGSGESTAEH